VLDEVIVDVEVIICVAIMGAPAVDIIVVTTDG
jgi:hypothetical protein